MHEPRLLMRLLAAVLQAGAWPVYFVLTKMKENRFSLHCSLHPI